MTRTLITGNLGYVGPVVVYRLAAKRVGPLVGYDMGYFANCTTQRGPSPEILLEAQYFGDVRSFPTELMKGIDAVVYLAALSNDPLGNAFEDVTRDVNATAAASLARLAKESGARTFVLASSCSVYGFAEGPRDETSPLNPLTAYARSKIGAERELEPLADEKFRVSALRFATACGMSPRVRLDLVLNDFVASAIATGRIELLSEGTQWRPLIDVHDMATAIEWALERGGAPFLAVNVGSNEWNVRIRDLAESVARVIPGTSVTSGPAAQPDKRSYQVSFDMFARLAPHHQPRATLAGTITALVKGLQGVEFGSTSFRNSDFVRLVVLRRLIDGGRLTPHLAWLR